MNLQVWGMSNEELAYYVDRHGLFSIKVKKEFYYTSLLRVHHEDEGVIRRMKEALGYGYIGKGAHKREPGRSLWWINFENARAISVCVKVVGKLEFQEKRCEVLLEFGDMMARRRRGPRNGRALGEAEMKDRHLISERLRKLPRPPEEVRYFYRAYGEIFPADAG